jgi:geranylgeranyl pyrophosphate synthase
MDFNTTLDEYQGRIDDALAEFFNSRIVEAQEYHPFMERVYSKLREYVLRKGKRLMSASVLLTYKGYTGKIDDKALRACIAIELYRHGILIHDDMADGDEMRRGGKSFHRIFDEKIALFAGNILNALAFKVLSELDARSLDSLLQDYQYVNESQILDYDFEGKIPEVKEWQIMASKRAASVFRATMLTGAILAGAGKTELKKLEDAAFHIGTAFDIQDDIIGLYELKTTDVMRKKKPLHICYAYKFCKDFDKVLKSGDVWKIKDKVRECGALDAAKRDSKEHAREAVGLIEQTRMSKKAKDFYVSFINYISDSLDWYE